MVLCSVLCGGGGADSPVKACRDDYLMPKTSGFQSAAVRKQLKYHLKFPSFYCLTWSVFLHDAPFCLKWSLAAFLLKDHVCAQILSTMSNLQLSVCLFHEPSWDVAEFVLCSVGNELLVLCQHFNMPPRGSILSDGLTVSETHAPSHTPSQCWNWGSCTWELCKFLKQTIMATVCGSESIINFLMYKWVLPPQKIP